MRVLLLGLFSTAVLLVVGSVGVVEGFLVQWCCSRTTHTAPLSSSSSSSSSSSQRTPTTTTTKDVPQPQRQQQQDHNATIWSYIRNIHRSQTLMMEREENNNNDEPLLFLTTGATTLPISPSPPHHLVPHDDDETSTNRKSKNEKKQQQQEKRRTEDRNRRLLPSRSLWRFLSTNQLTAPSSALDDDNNNSLLLSQRLEQHVHLAAMFAIRAAARDNDYMLILNLVRAVQHYCRRQQLAPVDPSSPSLLSEAIVGLCQTSASFSKIQTLWKEYHHDDDTTDATANNADHDDVVADIVTTTTTTPREVNAMLLAYQTHRRVRGALAFYRQHHYHQQRGGVGVDSYGLCTVLSTLKESIIGLTGTMGTTTNATLSTSAILTTTTTNATLRHPILRDMAQSPCWQWHEALQLLDDRYGGASTTTTSRNNDEENNDDTIHDHNIVCSHWLQLNERIASIYPRHNGPFMARRIRDYLLQQQLLPPSTTTTTSDDNDAATAKSSSSSSLLSQHLDAVTTTLLIRGLNHWKEAEHFAAPFPHNPYVYSAAISVCGRRFDIAMNFYGQYKQQQEGEEDGRGKGKGGKGKHSGSMAVTNAILKTCAGRNRARERLAVAMTVVDDALSSGDHDTITWNSLLAVVVATRRFIKPHEWQILERDFAHWFIHDNDDDDDSSLLTLSSHQERLVRRILSHPQATTTLNAVTYKHAIQAIGGTEGIPRLLTDYIPPALRTLDLYNQALAMVAERGDLDQLFRLLSMMQQRDGIRGNDDTKIHIIRTLGTAPESRGQVGCIVLGTDDASTSSTSSWAVEKAAAASYGIHLREWLSNLGPRHYAAAIEACVRAGDHAGSQRLWQITTVDAWTPGEAEKIATAMAEIALTSSSPPRDSAIAAAHDAYKIISSLRQPSITVLQQTTKACFRVGLWGESRALLKRVHQYVLDRPGERVTRGNTIGCLHRELLKGCSRQGNLTVALALCQDIHSISRQLVNNNATTTNVGMGAMEWKYFITTAAKSGNWKLCLSTLQYLRAPLIAANPALQSKTPESLKGHYAKLESTLNHAVRCFAKHKQFAWILRVVDGWIEWSGRPPPLTAARAAVRCFASEQRIPELNTLLAKIMAMETTAYNVDRELYREWLYVSAITALYNNGLYEYADDQFVTGVAHGAIQFPVSADNNLPVKKCITLDLHGMNLALAHSAVSIALQREASYHNDALAKPIELMIITGRGMNSKLRLRPVLRPAVQQMLVEEFYPPLGTTTSPGNTGVLAIPNGEISAWLDYQSQQRGVRMLLVAAMLKNLAVKVVSRISDISGGND